MLTNERNYYIAKSELTGSYYFILGDKKYDITDYFVAHDKKRWVSVADRLPDSYISVICCDYRDNIFDGWMNPDGTWHNTTDSEDVEVIKWMPIPQ